MSASHLKSVAKAISWRVIGALDTFAVSFMITGKVGAAASIMSFEVVTKTVLYYGHERAWEHSAITAVFAKVKA